MLKSDLLKMIDAAVVDSRKSDMIKDILEMNETDLAKVNAFIFSLDAAFTEKDYFSRKEVIDIVDKMIQENADSVRRESKSSEYRYRGSSLRYIKPPYTPRALRAYISLVKRKKRKKRKKRMIEEAKKNRLE